MKDYLRPTDSTIKKARLNIDGVEYTGRGLLIWEVESGFKIEILLDQQYQPLPSKTVVRRTDVLRERDNCLLRLYLANGNHAYVTVNLRSKFGLGLDNRLSCKVSELTFFEKLSQNHPISPNMWTGTTIVRSREKLYLPDSINEVTSINDRIVNKSQSIGGIDYKDENLRVIGRMLDDQNFEVYWSLSKNKFDKKSALKWSEALRMALSVLTFQVIKPLKSTIQIGSKERTVIVKKEDAERIGIRGGGLLRIFHDEVINLTRFFASEDVHVSTCYHIFNQITEASNQKTWVATELLISTILEAALRTIYNYPFVQGAHGHFPRRECMTRFRDQFWTPAWEPHCARALTIFINFRHRNAHPEWLTEQQGGMTEDQRAESLDDMRFLSWFYRHMILGMAGFKNINPLFPDF